MHYINIYIIRRRRRRVVLEVSDIERRTWTSQKLVVAFGTDAEHLCRSSRESDFYFTRNHNQRHERTK